MTPQQHWERLMRAAEITGCARDPLFSRSFWGILQPDGSAILLAVLDLGIREVRRLAGTAQVPIVSFPQEIMALYHGRLEALSRWQQPVTFTPDETEGHVELVINSPHKPDPLVVVDLNFCRGMLCVPRGDIKYYLRPTLN